MACYFDECNNEEAYDWLFDYTKHNSRCIEGEIISLCYNCLFPNISFVTMFKVAKKYIDLNDFAEDMIDYEDINKEIIVFLFKVDYGFDYPKLLSEAKIKNNNTMLAVIESITSQV